MTNPAIQVISPEGIKKYNSVTKKKAYANENTGVHQFEFYQEMREEKNKDFAQDEENGLFSPDKVEINSNENIRKESKKFESEYKISPVHSPNIDN